jgi:hypothetical protein
MAADWMVEDHEPGWLGRMIAPNGAGRPATGAVALGALAAVAFVLSMAFDWAQVSVNEPEPSEQGPSESPTFLLHAGMGTLDSLSFVYAVGMVVMLGAVGAVVTRPELALRLRLSAIGVTVGLIAVVVSATIRLPTAVVPFGLPSSYGLSTSIDLGLFFGYGAVVLPLAAIWLASRPAARAQPVAEAVAEEEQAEEEDEPTSVPQPRGLSVSGGGPLDLTVTPG